MTNYSKIVKKLRETYGSLELASENIPSKEYISTGNCALDLALDLALDSASDSVFDRVLGQSLALPNADFLPAEDHSESFSFRRAASARVRACPSSS